MFNIKEADKVKLALVWHTQHILRMEPPVRQARFQQCLKTCLVHNTPWPMHPHCHCLPAAPSAAPMAGCQLTPEAAPLLLLGGAPKRPTGVLLPAAAAAASEVLPAPNLVLVSAPNSGCGGLPGPAPAWPAVCETMSALMHLEAGRHEFGCVAPGSTEQAP